MRAALALGLLLMAISSASAGTGNGNGNGNVGSFNGNGNQGNGHGNFNIGSGQGNLDQDWDAWDWREDRHFKVNYRLWYDWDLLWDRLFGRETKPPEEHKGEHSPK